VVSIDREEGGLVGACKNARREWTPARQPEPGTSKWNKIEHRLLNWRGRTLTSHEIIVQTIAATTTSGGLSVHADSTPRSIRPAPQPVDRPETGSIKSSRALRGFFGVVETDSRQALFLQQSGLVFAALSQQHHPGFGDQSGRRSPRWTSDRSKQRLRTP
jgi:hypothetical protein